MDSFFDTSATASLDFPGSGTPAPTNRSDNLSTEPRLKLVAAASPPIFDNGNKAVLTSRSHQVVQHDSFDRFVPKQSDHGQFANLAARTGPSSFIVAVRPRGGSKT